MSSLAFVTLCLYKDTLKGRGPQHAAHLLRLWRMRCAESRVSKALFSRAKRASRVLSISRARDAPSAPEKRSELCCVYRHSKARERRDVPSALELLFSLAPKALAFSRAMPNLFSSLLSRERSRASSHLFSSLLISSHLFSSLAQGV